MPQLENEGSLITVAGTNTCLGYLLHFQERTFEPVYGEVAVTEADAREHNRLLDEALLKGLDDNCLVGQRGTFYLKKDGGVLEVRTWMGVLVSDDITTRTVSRRGRVRRAVYFRRGGKTYAGLERSSDELLNFKRVR